MARQQANPFKRQAPMGSLMASAQRLTKESIKRDARRAGTAGKAQAWQEDAWDMFDLVGEQHFLVTTLASRLAQAHIYVGVYEGDEASEPVQVTDQKVLDVFEALAPTRAQLGQILYRLAVNLSTPGEGWLVGVPLWMRDEEYAEVESPTYRDYEWHMLSVSELQVQANGEEVVLNLNNSDGEELRAKPDELYLMRIWRPHPRRWFEADSPTRANLPVLRELVGLTMHISAQVDSRLAGAGLLVVPKSAQRALQIAAGLPEDSEEDQFTEALMEAMLTPIGDRGSASAVVPLVVTAPDEAVDKFNYITFAKPLDTEARSLREEAIRRLAMGQDAPPELLLGTAGMNHWGGWLVKEETVSNHIEPPLALICDALTSQYLRPTLVDDLGMDEAEVQRYVIWYDVEHLITRPNLSEDAKDLHRLGVLTDEALVTASGFDTSDMPTMRAAARMVLAMVQANPSLVVEPGVPALLATMEALIGGTPLSEVVAETVPDETAEDVVPAEDGEPPATPGAPPSTAGDPAELP